jgi:hypothetical protein
MKRSKAVIAIALAVLLVSPSLSSAAPKKISLQTG